MHGQQNIEKEKTKSRHISHDINPQLRPRKPKILNQSPRLTETEDAVRRRGKCRNNMMGEEEYAWKRKNNILVSEILVLSILSCVFLELQTNMA
jgi:hypothetical protein